MTTCTHQNFLRSPHSNMGKKALSQSMKNFKKLRAEENKLTQAVDAFNDARQRYTSKKRTYDDVAAEFGVDPSTLRWRVQGKGKSMLEFNTTKQKLTVVEEKVLVKFMLERTTTKISTKMIRLIEPVIRVIYSGTK